MSNVILLLVMVIVVGYVGYRLVFHHATLEEQEQMLRDPECQL